MQDINQLILGDNLEILKNTDSDSVDLIYLDPPFFSNRNYEVIWGDSGEVRSFQDRWSGGVDHYIAWLKERVIEMHRVLKPTGSLFLHCDWHANAYIRAEILDKIFGYNHFHSEIIWKRTSAHSNSKGIGNSHDTIFYYSKSKDFKYNQLYQKYDEEYVETYYRYVDTDGRKFMSGDLVGHKGVNKDYEWKGIVRPWRYPKDRLDELDKNGKIFWTRNSFPRFKRFIEDMPGMPLQTIWADIKPIGSWSKEGIGYPTQKPESLLKRIIEMSTVEDDIVLDPFVGGGTTIAVADKLNRKWIGIDQSVQAVKVTEFRLNQQQDLFSKPFMVQLHKYDYDTLRYKDAFEFENFIVTAFGGRPNTKQRSDLGIDGKTLDNVPIQVKRSDGIGRNVIDNFHSAIQRSDKKIYEKNKAEMKPVGFILAFSFGKGAIQEVARLKNEENAIIKLVTVEEIVPIAKKPSLTVSLADKGKATDKKALREIEFTAIGESAAGIEFYSWDFNYNGKKFVPSILLDKQGKQIHKFNAGQHQIAVKIVDNDGLENIEVIKLKVNGILERQ